MRGGLPFRYWLRRRLGCGLALNYPGDKQRGPSPLQPCSARDTVVIHVAVLISGICLATALLLELEDALHQQPLLARRGLGKRLLKPPHESLPFLHFRVCAIGFPFILE